MAVFLVYCAGHIWYVAGGHAPLFHDSAIYPFKTRAIYQAITSGSLNQISQAMLEGRPRLRPPMHPLRALMLNPEKPGFYKRIIYSNLIWVLISLILMTAICRRFKLGVNWSIVTITFLGMPMTAKIMTTNFCETTLIIFVLLFFYLALGPINSVNSFFLGLTAAAGILTKFTYPIFIFVPAIYALIQTTRSNNRAQIMRNLVFFLIPVLLLAVPWYVHNFEVILNNIDVNLNDSPDRPLGSGICLEGFLYYILNTEKIFSFAFLVISLIGFIFAIATPFKGKKLLGLHLLFMYLIFSIIPHKELRHIYAATPFFVLFAAIPLKNLHLRIKSILLKDCIIGGIACIAILNICGAFWSLPVWSGRGPFIPLPSVSFKPRLSIRNPPLSRNNVKWPYREIFESIPKQDKKTLVNMGVVYQEFNGASISYYGVFEEKRDDVFFQIYAGYPEKFIKSLCRSSYIIFKSGHQSISWKSQKFQPLEKIADTIRNKTNEFRYISSGFTLHKTIPVNDSISVEIYRRVKSCEEMGINGS